MQDDVLAGDGSSVTGALAEVQRHAAAAESAAHGPHWTVAAHLPWVGDDVRAVQTVSEVVDDLARDVLPNLVDVASAVEPSTLAPVDGRVDLAPLQQAEPTVVAAAERVVASRARLDAIDVSGLLRAVAGPVTDLQVKVADLAMTTATASRAVQLLPPMLGADGPRDYLVLVQNPAEPRATGGVPALVLLHAEDGEVTVTEQRSAGVGNFTESALPLTDEEKSLFTALVGAFMGDVTFTPDFPRSAELARAIWEKDAGSPLDGVLSIEPGAIASLLGVTGPVDLTNGVRLTADNAAQWLMNTVYLDYADSRQQDALFGEATARAFTALASGAWDPAAMVDVLAADAREGRLMVWSAHEDEQRLLAGTVLSGELTGVRGESPVVGLFVNDGSQSKMGYYLAVDATVTATRCRPDGSQALTVRVELTSTAPPEAASLPSYISGGRVLPAGQMRENVLLYAPQGGLVDDVRVEGADAGVHAQFHDGLAVAAKTLVFAPGDTVVLEYDLVTGPGQSGAPLLRTTPLAQLTTTVGGPACGPAGTGGSRATHGTGVGQ